MLRIVLSSNNEGVIMGAALIDDNDSTIARGQLIVDFDVATGTRIATGTQIQTPVRFVGEVVDA